MNGLLFLNGEPPRKDVLENIDYANSFVVCADGAYNYLSNFCTPDILVGDFDSIKTDIPLVAKKVVRLNKEKDFTDGHIAMQEIINVKAKQQIKIEKIYIYGALGGSADHELSNYSLLYLAHKNNNEAIIISKEFEIYLATGKFIKKVSKGKRVSLVPFSDQLHILDTKGLKYPIKDEVYTKLHIKGISNEAVSEEIGYTIVNGYALVFIEV